MSLQVIAVGPPRTGTSSLKVALQSLGFARCMHMDELFNQPNLVDHWIELFETGKTDFATLFAGYQSSADFPGCLAYRELMAHYPEAKFIVNYRDADAWYDSMLETVYAFVPRTAEQKQSLLEKGEQDPRYLGIAKTLALVEVYLLERHYAGQFADRERTIARYHRFFTEVRETIPASRRLDYRLGDGWEPLCSFLGKDVPTESFPFKNKRQDFITQVGGMISGGGKLKIK